MWGRIGLIAVAAFSLGSTWAAEVGISQSTPPSEGRYFREGGVSTLVYAGGFAANDEPQFSGVRNEYAFGVGICADLERSPRLGMDLDLLLINRDYTTPLAAPFLGTIDNDTRIETTAIHFGGRLFYPVSGALRLYLRGGLGYHRTLMRVSGTLLGIPGTYEDSDSSIAPYYGAGLRYHFDDWSLGLDYRHINLHGSFRGFGIDDADIGGDTFMLAVGWRLM